jgi:predicted MFS family arabinose efflux permease
VIVGGFVVAIVFGALFILRETHASFPMLDLAYFKNHSFTGGSLAIGLVFFGMFGMFFLVTQYLQLARNYTALGAGVRMLPFAITLMIVAPSSARVAERISVRWTVCLGLFVAGCGQLLMSRNTVDSPYLFLVVSIVVLAAGMGLTMAPSTASIMSALPLAKAGVGSAMNDTTRELGGALGVAVLGTLVTSRYRSVLSPALAGLPQAAADQARASLGGALGVAAKAGDPALALAARHAFVTAMSTALVVGAIVAWLASFAVSRVLPARTPARVEEALAAAADEAIEPVTA